MIDPFLFFLPSENQPENEYEFFIFWYKTTSNTGKKTVDHFSISFIIPEISAFKEV